MRPARKASRRSAVRVANGMASTRTTIGAASTRPIMPVWLKAKGLDPGMIGLVLAAPMVVRVLAIPFATRTADRRDALRAGLIVTSCLSVAGYMLVGLAEGATEILIAYALASLAFTPVMPLAETY